MVRTAVVDVRSTEQAVTLEHCCALGWYVNRLCDMCDVSDRGIQNVVTVHAL